MNIWMPKEYNQDQKWRQVNGRAVKNKLSREN